MTENEERVNGGTPAPDFCNSSVTFGDSYLSQREPFSFGEEFGELGIILNEKEICSAAGVGDNKKRF